MKLKKSQMEIMGLVIIVLLITTGLMFAVYVMINKKPSAILSGAVTNQYVDRLGIVMKRTTTDCYGLSVGELLRACAKKDALYCSDTYCCDYVEEKIDDFLRETLQAWGNKSYYYKASRGSDEIFRIVNGVCYDRSEGVVQDGQVVLSSSGNVLVDRLKICG